MTNKKAFSLFDEQLYLLGSRPLTHVSFWLSYYLIYSLIWIKPEQGIFASFYLEFILLPVRVMAVYLTLYWLMPQFLLVKKYLKFIFGFIVVVILGGMLQRLISYFFFETLLLGQADINLTLGSFVRNITLVNTTVIFVSALKIFKLYINVVDAQESNEQSFIEVKADRKTHRVNFEQINYIEGMGNYVTYHLQTGQKLVVYRSIKATLADLPTDFIRLHRSFIVNKNKIQAYNTETVQVGGVELPRGKGVSDDELQSS